MNGKGTGFTSRIPVEHWSVLILLLLFDKKKQAERDRTGTNGTVKRMETYERKKQYCRYLNPTRLKKTNVTNQKGLENDIIQNIFEAAMTNKNF